MKLDLKIGVATMALLYSGQAFAQDAEPDASGDIIVTAQRRAQSLQDVPLSVTAVSGTQLEKTGITGTLDIGQVTPGLQLRQSSYATLPVIRGIGSSVYGPGIENPVAVYVDGVYLASSAGLLTTLSNVDRIEVLKGPQGTLFGRNSTGGLIQIITKQPSRDFSGKASLSFGNYATGAADLYITGGLSDTLAADLSAHYDKQGVGYGTNLYNGHDVNRTDYNLALRSKILWQPGTGTDITIAGSYSRNKNTSILALGILPGYESTATYNFLNQQLTGQPLADLGGFYDVNHNIDPVSIVESWVGSVELKQDLGFATVKSITAVQGTTAFQNFKLDSVPFAFVATLDAGITSRAVSEELQLSSNSESKFEWTAGLFYYHAKDARDPGHVYFGPIGAQVLFHLNASRVDTILNDEVTTNSIAGYAQGTYPILPNTKLTLGGRYTHETRAFDGTSTFSVNGVPVTVTPVPTPGLGIPSSITFNNFSYRIALDHQFTKRIMGYISYSTGFKSGSFNTNVPSNLPFLPEKIKAAEIGFKTEFFDRRLRFNPSIFYYKYTNIQVGSYSGTSVIAYNGAAADIYGVDLDAQLQLTNSLTVSGGMSYVHDRFTSFPNADYTYIVPDCDFSHPSSARVCQASAKGNRLQNTPDFSANINVNWRRELAIGLVEFNANLYHSSSWYGTVDNSPDVRQPAYEQLNLSLAWEPRNRDYRVSLWGKNLLDEKISSAFYKSVSGVAHTVLPPLTFGATFEVRF